VFPQTDDWSCSYIVVVTTGADTINDEGADLLDAGKFCYWTHDCQVNVIETRNEFTVEFSEFRKMQEEKKEKQRNVGGRHFFKERVSRGNPSLGRAMPRAAGRRSITVNNVGYRGETVHDETTTPIISIIYSCCVNMLFTTCIIDLFYSKGSILGVL